MTVNGCSKDYVGQEIVTAINVAGLCTDGIFPVGGGLMDQPSWFIELWQQLRADENRIEADRLEQRDGRRSN